MGVRFQAEVSARRSTVEAHLLRHTTAIPPGLSPHAAAFRLHRTAAVIPTPSLLDIVRFAWQHELPVTLNPFLSRASCGRLREAALVWLQLCVLEDRLRNLRVLAGAGEEYRPQLVQVGRRR